MPALAEENCHGKENNKYYIESIPLDSPITRFRELLESLSTQFHVSFIVEATPLHPVLSLDKAKTLADDFASERKTPKQCIESVASAFDYDAEAFGDRTFLLRKRYSDPKDMPFVTLGECKHALLLLKNALSPVSLPQSEIADVSAPDPIDTLVGDIRASMTAEQIKAMSEGISVKQLTDEQKGRLRDYALYHFVGSFSQDVSQALKHFQAMQQKDAVLCWLDKGAVHSFAFTTTRMVKLPDGVKRVTWEYPLSHGARATIFGGVWYSYPKGVMKDGKYLIAPPDATAPDSTSTVSAESEATIMTNGGEVSLGELIRSMNRSTGSNDANSSRFNIEPDLAPKTVVLVGCEPLTPKQQLTAIAQVYGLRLTSSKDGVMRLSFPTPSKIDWRFFQADLLRYLPEPLVRSWRASVDPEMRRLEAVKKLRQRVQPRVPYPDGRLSLIDLTEEEKHYLTIFCMTDCQDKFLRLISQPLPGYISDFDNVMLKGGEGVEQGNRFFAVGLNYNDKSGQHHEVMSSIQLGGSSN